jgi:hypothetical protein
MQLSRTFFINENCAYTARFMRASQKGYHGFRRNSITVFWSHNYFALIFSTAKKKAEGTLNLFFSGEGFEGFMEDFSVVQSENEYSSKLSFSIVQGFMLLAVG